MSPSSSTSPVPTSGAVKPRKPRAKPRRKRRKARDADGDAALIARARDGLARSRAMYSEARAKLGPLRVDCLNHFAEAFEFFSSVGRSGHAEAVCARADLEAAVRAHRAALACCPDHGAHTSPEEHEGALAVIVNSGRADDRTLLDDAERCIVAQANFEDARERYEDACTSAGLVLKAAASTQSYCHWTHKAYTHRMEVLEAARIAWRLSCQLLTLSTSSVSNPGTARKQAVETTLRQILTIREDDARDKVADEKHWVAHRTYRAALHEFNAHRRLDLEMVPSGQVLNELLATGLP
jgi:hypothetical protein